MKEKLEELLIVTVILASLFALGAVFNQMSKRPYAEFPTKVMNEYGR